MIIETSKAYGFTIGHCKSGLFNLIKNTDTDPEAAFKLGMMYLKGQNVEQNTHKAMFYLNQARNLGHDKADITFAYLYKYGAPDLEKDPLEAAEFLGVRHYFLKMDLRNLYSLTRMHCGKLLIYFFMVGNQENHCVCGLP